VLASLIFLLLLLAGSGEPPTAPAPAEAQPDRPCGWAEGLDAGPRQEALLRERRRKCENLEPYRPGTLERQARAVEKAERPIKTANLLGFYPRIQTIDHRSQWAVGTRFWRPDLGPSRFDVAGNAFWSFPGFLYYDVQAGMIPHRGQGFPLFAYKSDDVFELANVRQDDDSRVMLYSSFGHRWAPKFDYFGRGPDSQEADRSTFSLRDTTAEGIAGYRFWPRLTLSGRFGYYWVDTGPGEDDELPQVTDVFAPAAVPGIATQPDFLRYGAAAVFDARDVARNPHGGGLVSLEWVRYDQRGGSAFTFDRYAIDARGFAALGHPQRILALRAYFSRDDHAVGARVPFYLLAFLGGSHTLRGFASQRFRGEKIALLQAEYRWEAAPAIELALFADSGAVAETTHDELGRFRTDGGFGLRFKSHETTLLRLDFAWSDEAFRFLVRFNASF